MDGGGRSKAAHHAAQAKRRGDDARSEHSERAGRGSRRARQGASMARSEAAERSETAKRQRQATRLDDDRRGSARRMSGCERRAPETGFERCRQCHARQVPPPTAGHTEADCGGLRRTAPRRRTRVRRAGARTRKPPKRHRAHGCGGTCRTLSRQGELELENGIFRPFLRGRDQQIAVAPTAGDYGIINI